MRRRTTCAGRAAAAAEAPEAADPDDFLRTVEAEVVVFANQASPDPRALELVNKTNQFNLNGRRYTESEWRTHLRRPDAFHYLVGYRDKFGPLGDIAVIAGRRDGDVLLVDTWVMSCRAFSRRIEHQCVRMLFDQFPVGEIAFDYRPTERNGPCQEFFAALLEDPPGADATRLARMAKDRFAAHCPPLFHRVKVTAHG